MCSTQFLLLMKFTIAYRKENTPKTTSAYTYPDQLMLKNKNENPHSVAIFKLFFLKESVKSRKDETIRNIPRASSSQFVAIAFAAKAGENMSITP